MSSHTEVKTVHWKLKTVLEKHKTTPYALAKTSGLSMLTVYAIVNNKKKGLHFEVLAAVLRGLEELTGKKFTPNDILEVSRA